MDYNIICEDMPLPKQFRGFHNLRFIKLEQNFRLLSPISPPQWVARLRARLPCLPVSTFPHSCLQDRNMFSIAASKLTLLCKPAWKPQRFDCVLEAMENPQQHARTSSSLPERRERNCGGLWWKHQDSDAKSRKKKTTKNKNLNTCVCQYEPLSFSPHQLRGQTHAVRSWETRQSN